MIINALVFQLLAHLSSTIPNTLPSFFTLMASALVILLLLPFFTKSLTQSIAKKVFFFCFLALLLFLLIALIAIDNLSSLKAALDNINLDDSEQIKNIHATLKNSIRYIVYMATFFSLVVTGGFLFLHFKILKPILLIQDQIKTIIYSQEIKKIEVHSLKKIAVCSKDEIGALAKNFNMMLEALTDSQQNRNEKQKILDDDLKAAAQVQTRFLPSPTLKLPNVNLAWAYLPCYLVGGDLFNAIQLDENRIIFYVLDVSGHDVTSAMVTVSISQFLMQQQTAFLNNAFTPKEILNRLDIEYPIERFEKYFTIFYAIFDIKTGKLCYSSAGHPPAILLHPDRKFELLECGGTVIGLNQSSIFHEEEKILEKGSKLILYTDGVIEFCNPEGTFFGAERLYALMEKHKRESAQVIEQEFRRELREFGINVNSNWQDDVSFMCIEIQ